MYNEIIEILKTWHPAAQFFFLFFVILPALGIVAMIFKYIGEFFTGTLPVLVRGWPVIPDDEEENSED